MQIFTKPVVGGSGKPGRSGGLNLWRQWARNPGAVRWLLRDADVLRPDDIGAVRGWAERQAEWGLHVRLHAGAAGSPQIAEVFGPDLVEPHVLIHRVGEEIQVDEAHGASRCCGDMAEALGFVENHT